MNAPMSDFGRLLADTFKACEGRSAVVLDRVLTVKVRAWADSETEALGVVVIEPVQPWEIDA